MTDTPISPLPPEKKKRSHLAMAKSLVWVEDDGKPLTFWGKVTSISKRVGVIGGAIYLILQTWVFTNNYLETRRKEAETKAVQVKAEIESGKAKAVAEARDSDRRAFEEAARDRKLASLGSDQLKLSKAVDAISRSQKAIGADVAKLLKDRGLKPSPVPVAEDEGLTGMIGRMFHAEGVMPE